jgi:hypothetical protein
MARGECTFRQRDVTAALKAARDAGAEVARVEIDKAGKIIIIMGKPNGGEPSEAERTNEWDEKEK